MKQHSSLLSQHLARFVADSSVRSLRRTVLSDIQPLRVFWTLFVLACFVGMTLHLTLLSLNFLKGDLAVDMKFSSTAEQPFPSVSYCDGTQFSEESLKYLATERILSPKKFSDHVREQVKNFYRRRPDIDRGFALLIENYNNYLATVLGTLAKAKRSLYEITNLGASTGAPLIRVLLISGRVMWLAPSAYRLVSFHHPSYISCHTITLPANLSKLAQSIILVMPRTEANFSGSASYSDQIFNTFPIDGLTSMNGFVFDLHSEHSVPFSHSKLLLPANYFNQVKFTQCSLQRLKCSNLPGWHMEYRTDNGTLRKRYFDYNKEMCIVQSIRGEVHRSCNCTLDMSLMNLTDDSPRCNAFAPDADIVETYKQRELCVGRVLSASKAYEDQCESSCREVWFPSTVSGAPYAPINTLQRCVVQKTIYEMNHQGATISDIEDALLRNASLNQSASSLCGNASQSSVFIVELTRNPFLLQSFRQTPITTLPVFLCQVGSICGIWSGLSIAIIAELVDLIFRLVRYRCKTSSSVTVDSLQLDSRELPKL